VYVLSQDTCGPKGLLCMTPFSSILVDLEAVVTTELSRALGILMYYDQ